ncbi:MAG: YihA family ribosome biogenesis GTP-binding protein [Flavobacteriales bacterium]|jgi:GTP-binding protein|nr:YihA family ribosome biogenesis GTP-binding protein [Flavobacteriales bacterium]MBK6549939.1 YihA family ribosome biogenesis GTP-binding protein [Flavobacteriales bacterium]MBK6881895.1 YihA family ribosome biogenesis GTP-binding protein [Flavobacteriales bacterium]MBK7102451.1 YihA family ribosome biogenesis GTP-binding protein [Flavobacteriales bacterium]MBK7113190.1 YihA family ribosome biogenesis GTP-binding protein [Flavobacteriales bacterium]
MRSLRAEHLTSGRTAKDWTKPNLPEYAFIGRSNVGKSSLINMLCHINKLARVSNTPGRTRNVEHFRVEGTLTKDAPWMLGDLPGYGFAKASKTERAVWEQMIRTYLKERENLQNVFLLIDSRLEPQQNDLDMVQWLGENGIPFCIVFTKTDKLKAPKVDSNVAQFKRKLKESWEELPRMFVTSSETSKGRDELLGFIEEVNARWKG